MLHRKTTNHFSKVLILIFLFTITAPLANAQNWDIELLEQLNQNQSPQRDISLVLSKTTPPISFGLPVVMGATGLLNNDKNNYNQAIYLGATQVVNMALSLSLKYTINRPRPYETYPNRISSPYTVMTSSMPSGHTSMAFATATSLSLIYPQWYVAVPSFLWASAVGYSRMNLGVHYPSDVLSGAVLGSGSALFTYWVKKQISERNKQNHAVINQPYFLFHFGRVI